MTKTKELTETNDKQEEKSTKEVSLVDLTPASNADICVYEQALDQAFSDSHLKNIAITGPYGAGKSSILASYLHKKSDNGCNYKSRCLYISLAHLQPTKDGNPIDTLTNEESSTAQIEQLLEGKIINQIIHKIPADVARKVGFKVTDSEAVKDTTTFSIIASLVVGIILVWLVIPALTAIGIRQFISIYSNEISLGLIALAIVLIACIVVWVYKNSGRLLSALSHISRIKVEGNEIELFQSDDSAYFDKYLDRILYMLNHSDKDFFIFEDIDRFDTTLIFERLREINELANTKRKIKGQNKTLKFVYLLRDDIFLNKERAKFFDLLIPIIPVTNTNNSADKLFVILDKYNLKEKVNPDLVRALGLYIEDYRLIKNIANEFKIYSNAILEVNKLNADKLLAMIVYKNLFPKDFVDLQKQQGYVHFLLSSEGKAFLVTETQKQLDEEKDKYLKKIQALEDEALTKSVELAWAIIGTKLNKNSWEWRQISSNSNPTLTTLEQFIQNTSEMSQTAKNEYTDRKKLIKLKLDGEKHSCQERVREIIQQIDLLSSASLTYLISFLSNDIEVFLANDKKASFNAVRQNEYFGLLKYLLINGYLDETYGEYTTYFYAESMSTEDHAFLMNLHENGKCQWALPLSNGHVVLENISAAELMRPGALNASLLVYMLSNMDDVMSEKIKAVMQSFKGEYFSYAANFISRGEKVDEFAKYLFQVRPDSFRRIYVEKAVSPKEIEELVYAALLLLSEDEIKVLNEKSEGLFVSYISGNPDFLQKTRELDEGKVDLIISRLKFLGIQFPDIHAKDIPKNVLTEIIANHLYVITGAIVQTLFTNVLDYSQEDAIAKPLELLKGMDENDEIRKHLEKHFEAFVQAAIDNLHTNAKGNFQDDEKIIVDFINQEDLEHTAVSDYLSKEKKEIVPDLKEIQEHRDWKKLIALDLPCHSDENLARYINEFGVDSVCIKWLNTYFVHLPLISTDISKNEKEAIIDAIANKGTINIEVYISIFKTLGYTLSDSQSLKDDSFTKEKIIRLVQEECLAVNKNLFDFLQSGYPELLIQYVQSDINAFENLLTSKEVSFSPSGVGVFLSDHSVGDDKKEMYINHTEGSISLLSHLDISDKLQSLILDYHLYANELPGIIETYDTLGKKTQKALRRRVNEYVDNFIVVDAKKEEKLFYDIMHAESDMISNDAKVKILTANIPELEMDEIQKILDVIDGPTYGRILRFRAPTSIELEINHENDALFDVLKNNHLIKEYDTTTGGYVVERMPRQSI